MGITQSGLLHHFTNTEELLTEVLQVRDNRLAEAISEANATTLAESVRVTAEVDQADPGLTSLFTVLSAEATSEDHPAHEYFAQRYARIDQLVIEMVIKAQQAGTVRSDIDPRLTARLVIAVLDGALLQPSYLPDTTPAQLTDLLEVLLRR